MPNLAKPKTRKQLVLEYLQARPNEWVPGLELMNAQVGGLRAGARMFELTEDGYDIQSRSSKTSDVYEYMLVVDEKPVQLTVEDIWG